MQNCKFIEINDVRTKEYFKGITFSKFLKSKVKKEIVDSIYNCNIEPACYWCSELICSGHFTDLWDLILLYLGKNINIANPKLSIYLYSCFEKFKKIVVTKYEDNDLNLRNNSDIRKIFAQIIVLLCLSKKKYSIQNLTIKNKNEFLINNLNNKLKAPNVEYANHIFRSDDPKEIFIAINEFAYNISEEGNDCTQAAYWFEWVMEYEKLSKNNISHCVCSFRSLANVAERYKNDVIWIFWEAILSESKKKDADCVKIINSYLNLFCIRYSSSCKNKRKYLIYACISFLTEKIDFNVPVIDKRNILENIVNNIDIIYLEVKKNEIMDSIYLENDKEVDSDTKILNVKDNTSKKSLTKIDKFNQILYNIK